MNLKSFFILMSTIVSISCTDHENDQDSDEEAVFTMKPPAIYGETVPPDSTHFPFYVSIHRLEDYKLKYFCAGSILKSDIIVTAAHCIVKYDKYQLRIRPNYDNMIVPLDSSKYYTVRETACDYVIGSSHDICILYLDKPIAFNDHINAIELPPKLYPPWTTLTGIGVGLTEHNDSPDELRMAMVRILLNSICILNYNTRWVTGLQLCASGENFQGAYLGDFGGPYVITESGVTYLVGIASYSGKDERSKSTSKPVVMANVYRWADWIYERM